MACKAALERLVEEVTGQGRVAPAKRSVNRWLKRWVEDGVLALGGVVMDGVKKGTRTSTYLTPPIPPLAWGVKKSVICHSLGQTPVRKRI